MISVVILKTVCFTNFAKKLHSKYFTSSCFQIMKFLQIFVVGVNKIEFDCKFASVWPPNLIWVSKKFTTRISLHYTVVFFLLLALAHKALSCEYLQTPSCWRYVEGSGGFPTVYVFYTN